MKKKLKKVKDFEKDPLDRDLSFIFDEPQKLVRLSTLLKHLPKDKTISLRLSVALVTALKEIAKKEKTQYQKLIRHILADYVGKAS
jgi:predicted DNA binding CopG/RHH family protein